MTQYTHWVYNINCNEGVAGKEKEMEKCQKSVEKMTIGEARKQKGMNRKELSEWLEIPYRTLENWENGVRGCPAYLEKLIVEKILREK